VQKNQGAKGKLTEGFRSAGGRLATTAAAEHGRRQAALVGKAAAGALRASGFLGSTREGPVNVPEGLGTFGDRRRRRIAGAAQLTGGGLFTKS
jgi:hypothetical protein